MDPRQFIEQLYAAKGFKVRCLSVGLIVAQDEACTGFEGAMELASHELMDDLRRNCDFTVKSCTASVFKHLTVGLSTMQNFNDHKIHIRFGFDAGDSTAQLMRCFANQFSKEV